MPLPTDSPLKLCLQRQSKIIEQGTNYILAPIDQVKAPGYITSTGISAVAYDGELLTFKSFWDNGQVAHFRLQKLSETPFEGDITVEGQLKARTRMIKYSELTHGLCTSAAA